MDNKNTPIFFPCNPDEFLKKLQEVVRNEIAQLSQASKPMPVSHEVSGLTYKPIYKAKEVCTLLSISRQTLHQWMKDGLIKGYKIKSRLFFLTEDVKKLLVFDPNV